jgi:propionyl-CoA carboxylase alpha chain
MEMERKIKTLLVLNRGEIACRIIRTCKKMGVKTVAVHSDADAFAPFVKMADSVMFLGASQASESYLNIPKIMETIKQSGVDAVHPGYGFLSEKSDFVAGLEKEGITFVGPNSKAIDAMGDKITSKITAINAGVSTVPGSKDVIKDVNHAISLAKEIGYPVMLKASAGGGGKGIRIVMEDSEMELLLASVKNEGLKNFGDDRIFMEKYIQNPRHIEIQVVADKHGNVVCLGERECSIQRNNQKIIEEAPSSFVTPEMRKKMYEQCVSLAKTVKYDSVGTVEFVVSQNREFYFLEMNTRLQVEHPVTEFVTGFDLVEIMIRIAQGEKLWFTQEDVEIKGHAFESRICAEDPSRGFLPSVGRISTYIEPKIPSDGSIRMDTGVAPGFSISPFYDAMIAKLITYGKTREEALNKNIEALNQLVVEGVENNILFLQEILKHERFKSGNISTSFIKEEYKDGFSYDSVIINDEMLRVVSFASLILHFRNNAKLHNISGAFKNPAHRKTHEIKDYEVFIGSKINTELHLEYINGNRFFVKFNNQEYDFTYSYAPNTKVLKITEGEKEFYVKVLSNNFSSFKLAYNGMMKEVFIRNAKIAGFYEICKNNFASGGKMKELEAPITGLVVHIHTKEGDVIKPGTPIITIEAMKMENLITIDFETIVKKVLVKPSQAVSIGDILIEFENNK